MASFKSRIRWKRRPFKRSASLTSVVHVGKAAAKGVESYCEDAAGEWEFVTKATDVACCPSRRNSVPTSPPAAPAENGDRPFVDGDGDCVRDRHPSDFPVALVAALAKSGPRPRPRSWLGALSQPFISEESLASLDSECKLSPIVYSPATGWLRPYLVFRLRSVRFSL